MSIVLQLDMSDPKTQIIASMTCQARIIRLLKNNKVDAVYRLLSAMEQSKVTTNMYHYNPLIEYFAKRGEWERMQRTMRETNLLGLRWDVMTITAVITGYAAHGNWSKAEELFTFNCGNGGSSTLSLDNDEKSSIPKAGEAIFIPPDTTLFDSMIDIAAKQGNAMRAEEWYTLMLKHGIKPTHLTYRYRIVSFVSGTRGRIGTSFSGVPDTRELSSSNGLHIYDLSFSV